MASPDYKDMIEEEEAQPVVQKGTGSKLTMESLFEMIQDIDSRVNQRVAYLDARVNVLDT